MGDKFVALVATSLCYTLLNKFVALVGSGQQPSRDEKGLKDWANITLNYHSHTGAKKYVIAISLNCVYILGTFSFLQ
jgi:hypothetical protein